jgi:hypothetical protein
VSTLDGAQVEVELGEQANVNLVGIVGPVGPIGPTGPPGGPMAGWFTPQQYGGVGDDVHDDTAAVQAAITAAGTTTGIGKGGVVYFPPGRYRCTQQLKYYPSTMWAGAGVGQSSLHLASDLWDGVAATPARFIVSGATPSAGMTWKMSDLSVIGPGGGSLGQVGAKTNGIFVPVSEVILNNVYVTGFFAGLEHCGDHLRCYQVWLNGNYYNLDYSDARVTSGNDSFTGCNFAGAKLASFHIGGNSTVEAALFQTNHLGFAPVGIFVTDRQNGWDGSGNPTYVGGTPRNKHAIQATKFDGMGFESVGNAGILDISSAAGFATYTNDSSIRGEGITWDVTQRTTNAPLGGADSGGAWAMVLRSPTPDSYIYARTYPWTAPPSGGVGVVKLVADPGCYPTFSHGSFPIPANFFGSGSNWGGTTQHAGRAELKGTSGTNVSNMIWGTAAVAMATTVINVGDVVEMTNAGWPTVQRATGTKPVFGVALTPSPGGVTATVYVQIHGTVAQINQTTAALINPGFALYLDATTTYQVNNTNTSGRLVAVSAGWPNTTWVTGLLRTGTT